MSIAGYLGITFMCLAYAMLMWALCIIAGEADRQMEEEFNKNCKYWKTTYGGDK